MLGLKMNMSLCDAYLTVKARDGQLGRDDQALDLSGRCDRELSSEGHKL